MSQKIRIKLKSYDHNLVDKKEVLVAADNKIAKLKKWSNIFESGAENE